MSPPLLDGSVGPPAARNEKEEAWGVVNGVNEVKSLCGGKPTPAKIFKVLKETTLTLTVTRKFLVLDKDPPLRRTLQAGKRLRHVTLCF